MKTITIATAAEIVARQAAALGGSWIASRGADDVWGVERYPFAELRDREAVIRIWINAAAQRPGPRYMNSQVSSAGVAYVPSGFPKLQGGGESATRAVRESADASVSVDWWVVCF